MVKTETVFLSPSLQQSPAEPVLDLLFVGRLSSLTVGAFKHLRTILTGRSFMSHCQAATHDGGGKPGDDRVTGGKGFSRSRKPVAEDGDTCGQPSLRRGFL